MADDKLGDVSKITPEFLAYFNKQKTDIEAAIRGVKSCTAQIVTLSQNAQAAFSPEDLKKISTQCQDQVTRATTEAKKGKALLDKMKSDGEAIASAAPKSERVQPYKSQYLTLCKGYVDAMKEHQKAKEAMKQVQTDTLVRRGEIVFGGTKSTDEIRAAAERDPSGFLKEAIMMEAATEAQEAYADAVSRAREVEQLVRSIAEVSQMFQDLAALVQHQSEMLDSIEENVEAATVYVKKGNDNLRAAIATQKKTRKCYCIMLCIGIVCVCLLVAGLGAGLTGKFKSF